MPPASHHVAIWYIHSRSQSICLLIPCKKPSRHTVSSYFCTNNPLSFRTAVCVPSIDQFVVLAVAYPRSIDSPLPKYAETTTLLRMNYLQERNIKPNRYSSIFGKFFGKFFASKSSTPPDLNEKPSSEQITLGFIEAFERVKNISSANSSTNITSAVISFPRFFSFEVHKLAVEAAQRAGIFPVHSTSPHQLFSMLENILEENITAVRRFDYTPKLLIIDYGLLYFDVQTHGRRCHLNVSLDWMGCINIIHRLVNRVVSTNADIQQQLDQGASYNTLKSAVYRAQYLMKMDRDVESWDEKVSKEDRPERWPLELDDWWTGQQKDAFISWEDIESVEAEYVSDLAELLDNLLICLEGERRSFWVSRLA